MNPRAWCGRHLGAVRSNEGENRTISLTRPQIALINRYREGDRNFVSSDLDSDSDNDLNDVCLDGIDLSRSFIVASFRGASLKAAFFRAANLKTCDFTGADLTGSDFSDAALCSATFVGARMKGAFFVGAYFHSHTLRSGELPDW